MWKVVALAFVGYFLVVAAWAVALPTNGTYDEKQHVVKAYATWDGQLLPGGSAVGAAGLVVGTFDAPRSLLPADVDCAWRARSSRSASCQQPVSDATKVPTPSAAAAYSPVYYGLVGLPLRLSPDRTGLLGSRLLSAAWSALLLALATAFGWRLRSRIAVISILLVATPMVLNLAGAINPNGLEISAGVLLIASLLTLARDPTADPVRRPADRQAGADRSAARIAAGVAIVLLLTIRQLGPVLFVLAAAACLLAADRIRRMELIRDRWLHSCVFVGIVGYAIWLLLVGGNNPIASPPAGTQMGTGQVLTGIAQWRWRFWVQQAVGQFGYGEATISNVAIALWYLMVACLIVPALWRGTARLRAGIVGLAVVSVAMLICMEIYFAPTLGWFAQSRYLMPAGVGVVLLAGFAPRSTLPRWLLVTLATVPIAIDCYALAQVMSRFQNGINAAVDPLHGTWLPEVGPVVPLLCSLIGGVVLGLLVWRSPQAGHAVVLDTVKRPMTVPAT